jgi:branched-chain amino acid transport system ATP-binding protein
MVALARALMMRPKLLLLDEPTAGLAPKIMEEIFAHIREINRTGIGVLMVEQNARRALEIADRGYVLAAGRNRFSGTGAELLANRQMAEAFLGG